MPVEHSPATYDGSHTPGPWLLVDRTVYALTQDGWRKGKPEMVNRFSVQVQRGHEAPLEELNANAILIAAAPDLLTTLEAAVQGLELLPFATQSAVGIDAMRSVIKKARGQ